MWKNISSITSLLHSSLSSSSLAWTTSGAELDGGRHLYLGSPENTPSGQLGKSKIQFKLCRQKIPTNTDRLLDAHAELKSSRTTTTHQTGVLHYLSKCLIAGVGLS